MTLSIGDLMTAMQAENPSLKDFLSFLSLHAKGNVLQIGLCQNHRAVTALLYGVERQGGHLWTVSLTCFEEMKSTPDHPQWTMIESDALEIEYVRTGGVPEEIDLLFINAEPDYLNTYLVLKSWGHAVKTNGLIIVAGVKANQKISTACDEYAKSYGMKFHVRQSEADLGVIFYPDNKEALNHE